MNQQIANPAAQPQPAIPTRDFTATFTSTRRGARLARPFATQQLDAWGHPYGDVSDAVALVVAELAANAVRHAALPGRDFKLALALSDGSAPVLRIELSDARAEKRPARPLPVAPPEAASGRNLLLVEHVAARWGVTDRDPIGKTVWAELDLQAAS
ncbi:ATP-binding protein [Streptomyces sp. NBC_00483]|uniref:ATP-binding protein n=1 Tax=Streptomyces sp. NBC_00483 TaxID=2975756 RepID=UPI002E192612